MIVLATRFYLYFISLLYLCCYSLLVNSSEEVRAKLSIALYSFVTRKPWIYSLRAGWVDCFISKVQLIVHRNFVLNVLNLCSEG
jgi:hypothetical protein